MATLEKIRSKSVFLFIIIIVALLAFILGDFLTSGRTYLGSGTTMMKAGRSKVDYNDYKNASENIQRNNPQNNQDGAQMEQTILQQLLMQKLLEEQYDQLGINITDDEISKMMSTPNAYNYQFLQQMAQMLGLPAADGNTVYQAINNPARYGIPPEYKDQLLQMWAAQEMQIEEALKQQAFMSLIDGLFTANELDAKSLYNDNMASTVVSYVSTPLASIPDSQVEVSDADINNKYNNEKAYFALVSPAGFAEPMRAIDYVVVNIEPSNDDYAAARAEVAQAIEALNTQPGLEGLAGRQKFLHETVTLPTKKIKQNQDLRTLPDSALAVDKVHAFPLSRANNTFTISKVQALHNEVDSVNLSQYIASSQSEADSIKALLAAGTSFDDIIAANPQQAAGNTWQNPMNSPQQIKDLVLTESIGKPFVYSDTVQGVYAVIQVNQRVAPKQYADIAVVKYTVDPSNTTISDIKTQLNSFLASNNRGDLFSANADSLYQLQHGLVSASSANIGNVKDTRKAVKWAMDAKKEQVKLFDGQNAYLIVAVKDIYDGDILPARAESVNNYLTSEVRKDKKAEKLLEQYAGKANDLAGYASLMKGEVRTDSAVTFTGMRLGNFMPNAEYALQGAIAAAAEGALIGPIQGANEVVVLQVGPTTVNDRPYNYQQDGRQFMNMFAPKIDRTGRVAVDPVLMQLLLGDTKVKNYSLNFVVDDQE